MKTYVYSKHKGTKVVHKLDLEDPYQAVRVKTICNQSLSNRNSIKTNELPEDKKRCRDCFRKEYIIENSRAKIVKDFNLPHLKQGKK